MKLTLALFLLLITASASSGEDLGWRDQQGQLLTNKDDRKALDGFVASVILTTDADWQEKWNAATTPNFTTTDKLKKGEQGTIL